MEIVLIRHSEPDYSFIKKDMNCQWANLAPLTKKGIEIAENVRSDERLTKGLILSSPYTRALQTAHVLFPDRNIIVEPMLHEWLPDTRFNIKAYDVYIYNKEYKENNGFHKDPNSTWEERPSLKNRIESVIEKYKNEEKIIIVAHERLISAFLDRNTRISYCEINVVSR